MEKNGLVPAHSSSREPRISFLLQEAQHLVGRMNGDRLSKGKFSASCKSSQVAVTALKQAGHPWTL